MTLSRPLLFKFPTPSQPPSEQEYLTLTRDKFFPGNTVTYNTDQAVGVAWDGTIGKTRVEVKDDLASARTGNLFIETGQQFGGANWHPSGLVLAAEQADIYLVVGHVGNTSVVFGFHPWSLLEYVKPMRPVLTKVGANGNRAGSHARGRVLPFRGQHGAELAKLVVAIPH